MCAEREEKKRWKEKIDVILVPEDVPSEATEFE